jgi:hypothetical protein
MAIARLITPVPSDRIHKYCGDGSSPVVGDIVQLDQGITFPDSKSGGIVYCLDQDGRIKWGADVYGSEIEVFR